MEDSKLVDALIGLYQTQKLQLELVRETQISVQALVELWSLNSEFPAAFDKEREVVKNGAATQALDRALKGIEFAIQALRQSPGSRGDN